MQISNEIKKPFSGPLLNEMVFNTKAELNAYLTNALRYAGMTVSCKEDNTVYVLNSSKTEWIPSGSVIKDRETVFNKRSKIKFDGDVVVQDDPTNNETIVTVKPNNRLTLNEVSAFSIVGGNGQATLKWSDPQDRSENGLNAVWKGTRLLRKTGSYPQNEDDGTLVVTNGVRDQYKDTGFTDLNLVNGVKYYYVLFPFTTLGTFTQPSIISGRDVTPSEVGGYQGLVLNFSSVPGDKTITLSWTKPDDVNYKGVRIVRKERGFPSSPSDGNSVYSGTGTSYIDVSLDAATAYYYTAFAYDNTNTFNSSGAQAVGITNALPKLGTVQNFSATPGNAIAVLKWKDPDDVIVNGIKVVTWFGTRVMRKTDGYPQNPTDGTLVTENYTNDKYAENGFIDSGLSNDTTYYYSAFPFDVNGEYSIDTSVASRVTCTPLASAGTIPAITNLVATPGDKTIRLQWNNPTNIQELEKIEIRMRANYPIDTISDGVLVKAIYGGTATDYTQTELTNGKTYYFKVFEYNKLGQVRTTDNLQVYSIPTIASYSESIYRFYAEPLDSKIFLTWVEPISTTYAGVVIRRKTGGYPTSISDGIPVGSTGFFSKGNISYEDTGLSNGTTYYYRAFSQNNAGQYNIDTSLQQISATPAPASEYSDTPTNVTFTPGDGKVTIKYGSWLPSGSESNATGVYAVWKLGDVAPLNVNDGTKVSIGVAPITNYTINNLINGEKYSIKLFAYKIVGSSTLISTIQAPSCTGTFTPTAVVSSGTIMNQTSIAIAGLKVELKWIDPTSNWSKTVIVRKKDSYPLNVDDGVKIVESTTKDQYKTSPYVDTTPDAGDYYYKAFTYNNSTVTIDNLNNFSKVTTFIKGTRSAPLSPTVIANTYYGVNIGHSLGSSVRVYSDKSPTLQTPPCSFTATPNTSYKFYAVYPEDANYYQSPPSVSTDVTTHKQPAPKSDPPILNYEFYSNETDTWTLGYTTSLPQNVDKSAISTDGVTYYTGASNWITSNIAGGLNRYAYARFIETDVMSMGLPSDALVVKTKRVKPSKPIITAISSNSVTLSLNGVDDIDAGSNSVKRIAFGVSLNGVAVNQSSPSDSLTTFTFRDLLPNTTYKGYVENKSTYTLAGGLTLTNILGYPVEFTTPPATTIGGVRVFKNESNPSLKVEYIGALAGRTPASIVGTQISFTDPLLVNALGDMLPSLRPVLYKNGSVNYALNTDDWSLKALGGNSNLTGVDGDVMIEFSKVYWKITDEGDASYRVELSRTPQPGFDCYAHKTATGEVDNIYIGAYPAYLDGTKLRSLSGQLPTTNKSNSEFFTAAQANHSKIELMTIQSLTLLQLIYLCVFRKTDSDFYGRGYNDIAGLKATGVHNDKGWSYCNPYSNAESIKFWGLEDLWGHVGCMIGNVYTNYGSTALIGGVYTTYGMFNPSNLTGYTRHDLTYLPNGNAGYGKGMSVKSEYGFLPSNTSGGSSSTYYCDICIQPSLNGTDKFLVFGGDGYYGSSFYAGIFSLQWHLTVASKYVYYGTRIQARG